MLSDVLDQFFGGRSKASRPKNKPRTTKLSIDLLEGRDTPSTIVVDPAAGHGDFKSIQAAINAAHPGDKILVDPGTYHEQILITKSNLTLTTRGLDAIIAPTGLTDPTAAIVQITGAKNVTINDFSILGDATAQYGIKVDGGASANITNNSIKNILGGNGAGIVVGKLNGAENTTGSANIVNNFVANYTKAGIVITNTGSTGTVVDNCVVGQGVTGFGALGIQVSFGANADIEENDVSGNQSISGLDAAGIFTLGAGTNTEIENNHSHNNDFGVFIESSTSVEVSENFTSDNSNDGIQLLGSSSITVDGNYSFENGGDGISIYSAGSPGDAAKNVISDNVSADNAGNGITVGFAGDPSVVGAKIVKNVIFDNGGAGVSVANAANTTIACNFIDADDGSGGAISTGAASTGTQIVGNQTGEEHGEQGWGDLDHRDNGFSRFHVDGEGRGHEDHADSFFVHGNGTDRPHG